MHEGAGWDVLGSFTGPIRAESWKDRLRSRVNEASLEKSGFGLVVVALYSHPLFKGSQRESIRRQIATARAFVQKHPDWALVRSPLELEAVLEKGKRALILSLEGASGVLESEEDLKEFVDGEGIRIVTPVHFIDDSIGGASLMPSALGFLANPLAWLRSRVGGAPGVPEEHVRRNPLGLRPEGRRLIEALLRRGVWIDLAHASDALVADVLPMLRERGQPILVSHTMLRQHYRAERGVTVALLSAVKSSGGIAGVIPSEDITGMTPVKDSPCEGGIDAFWEQAGEIASRVGAESLAVGSDVNAPLRFLPAPCAKRIIEPRGFFDYGQFSELGGTRSNSTERGPFQLDVRRFLSVWKRVGPTL